MRKGFGSDEANDSMGFFRFKISRVVDVVGSIKNHLIGRKNTAYIPGIYIYIAF